MTVQGGPLRRAALAAVLALSFVVALLGAPGPGSAAEASAQPSFPIRAAFYYPWYPYGFQQPGSRFHPADGQYSSTDAGEIRRMARQMQYAHIDAAFYSWWGPGSVEDRRFGEQLDATADMPLRWAVYYEPEGPDGYPDPSPTRIRSDLGYVYKTYALRPNYLRVNGRPVVFVWTEAKDACEMAHRWSVANYDHRFYVGLKVYYNSAPSYTACPWQPDAWYQYAPAERVSQIGHSAYSVSPGFYSKLERAPRLGRDPARFAAAVRAMVASGARWQLVTTFNEWIEGTSVQPAAEWQSASGFGAYLDALHLTPPHGAAPFNPVGHVDAYGRAPDGRVGVRGWARDPDYAGAIDVHVYVDGHVVTGVLANRLRSDVGAHGFWAATPPLPAGSHTVCVYAINAGIGSGNPRLGCARV